MECSCNAGTSYGDDGDSYYSERILKAAKNHICCECNKPIMKGEMYHYSSIFYERNIRNYKTCNNCQEIISIFFKDGWLIGSIFEELYSYIDAVWLEDLPSSCISKLNNINKNIICDMFQNFQK